MNELTISILVKIEPYAKIQNMFVGHDVEVGCLKHAVPTGQVHMVGFLTKHI